MRAFAAPHRPADRASDRASDRAAGRLRRAAALAATVAALAVALGTPARAERADRNRPINVEADRMQYDDQKQTNVFSGNVVLTRGTILVRADRLVLRQDADGFQYASATGAPASFRQKRDGVEQFIEGEARQIDYDGKLETFRLRQQATMRRTERERVLDEVHGGEILYETRADFFTVEGGAAGTRTADNPSGRVRVVIQPREPAGAGAPAPAAPARLEPAGQIAPARPGAAR